MPRGWIRVRFLQMVAIIEKLPLARKDFKSYLKHKRREMSLKDLIIRLQVKEGNKNNDKKNVIFVTKASVMEFSQNIKNKKANKIKLDPKGGIS